MESDWERMGASRNNLHFEVRSNSDWSQIDSGLQLLINATATIEKNERANNFANNYNNQKLFTSGRQSRHNSIPYFSMFSSHYNILLLSIRAINEL